MFFPAELVPPSFIILFAFISICLLSGDLVSGQIPENGNNNTSPTSGSGVFALPEIRIKLGRNKTVLQVEPNTPVELSPEWGSIELSCTADYPVKWEYLVNNKTLPVIDVVYRRLIRDIFDFANPKRNRFMALINFHGLLESQTGKYLCRHYNEKLGNNNYAISSYFDVFIPGNQTFNAISSVTFMNKTAPDVSIHCPVTDLKVHVRLYKLNEKLYNQTEALVWKPIYAQFEPTDGFRLFAGLGRELQGTYNCSADNGASIISVIADPADKELYHSTSPSISLNSSCWKNFKLIQYIRSKRLECFCKDSYGLFVNDNYEFENRQASCSPLALSRELEKCGDWRIEQFWRNEEKSKDICFHQRTQVQLDGSGSRPSLLITGKTFPNGDDLRPFPFTKFSITYNGFVDWAGDFMLAICRSHFCLPNGDGNNSLEYLETEPTHRQYFPLAHYQASWNGLIVNGTDVKLVYVFQAHSLSYAWFPYATGDIDWGNRRKPENNATFPVLVPPYSPEGNGNSGSASFRTLVNGGGITSYYFMSAYLYLFYLY